ncbi:MAG: TolB family protein [Acidimicrobiales bacterium]
MTLIDERPNAEVRDEVQVLFREARRRRRRRWFMGIVVLVVTIAMIATVALVRASSVARSPARKTTGPTQQAVPGMPSEVVAWEHFRLDVLSSVSGHVIRTLATDVSEFRGLPSLSVAPNGMVFFDDHAFIGSSPVDRIYSVPVSGGAPRFIADGRTPAVSPDGRFLAYVNNDPIDAAVLNEAITIEDLRTHVTRSWTDTAPEADLWALAWSPDSRLLSFRQTTGATTPGEVTTSSFVLDTAAPALTLDTAQRIPLAPGVSWAGFLAGTRPGALEGIGEVQLHGGLRLVAIDARSGRTMRRLVTIPGAQDATVQADASGKHLVIAASGAGALGFGRLYRWTEGSASATSIGPGILVAAWVPIGSR